MRFFGPRRCILSCYKGFRVARKSAPLKQMLSGLMSRCAMRLEWRKARPSTTCGDDVGRHTKVQRVGA